MSRGDSVHDAVDIDEEDLSGPVVDRRTTVKLLSGLGLGGMASLAGCTDGGGADTPTDGGGGGTDEDTDTPAGSDKLGGRLTAAWNVAQMEQLDPHFSQLTQATFVIGNFFSGLTEVRQDYTLQGDLATDWEVTDGGATLTFDLVEDAEFHNGQPFDATDVVFSLKRVVEEDTPHKGKLNLLQRPIDGQGIVVEDDYRVTLNFQEPFAPILMFLTPDIGNAGAIVNKEALDEMGPDQYKITPVGTGPFEVAEHELGSTLVADAFDGYFKEDEDGNALPYLDGVDFEPIQEASTRVNAMLTGDAGFMSLVPADQVEQLEQSQDVVVESRLGPNFGGLAFNVEEEPFTEKNVRLAVAKAIDKERYVEDVFFGRGQADTGILPPPVEWAYREEYGSAADQKPPDQRYAPEEAQQLAEEAGVTDPDIGLTVAQPELRGAKVMRSMLKEVLGWEVELNQQDFPTIFEQVPNGNFQAMPWGTSAAPDPDLAVYNQFGPPDAGNWWNYDEVRDQVDEQRTILDNDERARVLWEIEDQLIKDAPWAFLEHQDSMVARSTNLEGFTHLALVHRLRNVWLNE